MKNAIARLNGLTPEEASTELRKCCGSMRWAERMSARCPFRDENELYETAEAVWWSLKPSDWLEAFRSHPKIGEKKAASPASDEARRWSEKEQSGTLDASAETLDALAEANRLYEERFGYIFIVCATGKTAPEMLALLRERLHNEPDAELRIAAEEQRRITRLRLEKLLEAGWGSPRTS